MKVAAVQIDTRSGQVSDNLDHVERLARAAFDAGAKTVALPEFFSGKLAPNEDAFKVALPRDHVALEMMVELARRYSGTIGGSVLVADGDDLYNRYYLALADGTVHAHDKDLPTMWENAFYVGGSDDGVFETPDGGIGAAVCWELIRTQTLARMKGRVKLVLTGTHWWDMPENWPGAPSLLGPIGQYNRYMSEQAPVEFARRIGVPVVQASHSGTLSGRYMLTAGADWGFEYQTRFVGQTQIVDAQGKVLAARNAMEGAGFVTAEIDTTVDADPVFPNLDYDFWIPNLPLFHKLYWSQQNWAAKSYYRRKGRKQGLDAARVNEKLSRTPAQDAVGNAVGNAVQDEAGA